MSKPILIASDHGGFSLKEELKAYIMRKLKLPVKDLGTYCEESCDYPKYAYDLAKAISDKKYSRGILIWKSGIGNSIVANRLPGVRAALCYNLQATKLCREHNDSNVLVLGASFVKIPLAKRMVSFWLKTEFAGGRHQRRLKLITEIDKKIRSSR